MFRAQSQTPTRDTYVRMLKYSVTHELSRHLDPSDNWKIVADNLCMPPDYTVKRYNARDILAMNEVKHRGSCTEALLLDWGTLNSTVGAFIDALVVSRQYAAADYLCMDILKGGRAPRLPGDEDSEETELVNRMLAERSTGSSRNVPAEGIDPQPDADLNDTRNATDPVIQRISIPPSLETRYTVFPYSEIEAITDNFNINPKTQGGNFIGKGGFGTVFYGKVQPSGEEIAVKRLDAHDTVAKQFDTEIKTMLRFHHENILRIVGFSSDGPLLCLLYEYMRQGSLEDRLARKDGTPTLTIMQRVDIAKGTANGIAYLHSAFDEPMVHRDIKSANVLLNDNLQPKVADFGFARVGGHGNRTTTIVMTQTVIGTGAYMAPEAVSKRDVSVKLDTYSYGIILLELLSSLPAYDPDRKESSLREHILEDEDDHPITAWADPDAGEWNESLVQEIYTIAEQCLEFRKKKRPTMIQILPDIQNLMLPPEL